MRRLIPILAIAGLFLQAHGQATKKSVVIGTYFDRPNAVLALNPPNKNQGFLVPQLTTQERLSMKPVSPSDDGLMVFDVTLKSFYFWKDNFWIKGLGAEPEAVTFDNSSQQLSFGTNQTVDLSFLKELPETTASEDGMVLTTDRAGVIHWSDKSLFTDSQNLALSGNILNIDRGVAADLGVLTTGGSVISGPISNLTIVDGSVTSADLGAGIVTTEKLASGGADKILATDGAGKVTWADKTSMGLDLSATNESLTQLELASNQLHVTESANSHSVDFNAISLSGDVSGTVNENSVTRIQGNEVQSGTPGDGKILKWQAGKWVFADDNMSSITAAPMTRFSNLDVAEFFETNDPINKHEHRVYRVFGPTADFGYMEMTDKIKDVVAGLHLPHGSDLLTIKGFVWDNEGSGREIEVTLMRKELSTGAVVPLGSSRSFGASPSVRELSFSVNTLVDNARYIYFVRIHFDLGNDDYEADKLSQINQRLYGVSYEYTEPGNVISGPGTTQTLYVNSTAPSGPYTGQVWLDTTTHLLKFWDGSTWVQHQ